MTYKLGSNQYKKVRKTPTFGPILATAIGMGLLASCILPIGPDKTTQYLQQFTFGRFPEVAIAVEPSIAGTSAQLETEPTKENIVAYIMKVFGKYGTHVGVKAIECFYSESGLRTEAYNFNRNGTEDRGVAQINSIHGMKPDDAHNFIKNIDMAEKIYLRAGKSFRPWYGKLCK